jgi:hypothetical protein
MSNRNFDNRVIIQRLQNQNYARNLYKNNTEGQPLLRNPQNSDSTSSRFVSFVPGAQTEYFRGLVGGGMTVSVGGIVNIPPFPPQPSVPQPSGIYINSKNNTTSGGFPVGGVVTKDMDNENYTQEFDPFDFQAEFFPGMADFVDGNIVAGDKAAGDRLIASYWRDLGNDVFDDWGYFYLYDVNSGKYYFPLISPQNQANGDFFTQTFDAFGRTFTITHGWAVQGIFKFDICVNDNLPFRFGAYGNMGSDGDEDIENLTYPYTISANNLTLHYQKHAESGDPIEILYSYWIPKTISQNTGQTYDFYNDEDDNSMMSKEINNGLIVYFAKQNDVKEWVVNDLQTSDILCPPAPPEVPGAPSITSVTPENTQLTVNFTGSSTGTLPITDYEYSIDSGSTFTSAGTTSSPIIITGLTNGTSYDIVLRGVNSVGPGVLSNTVSATPSPAIEVIILGDSNVGLLSTSLQSARAALGYSIPLNITTQQLQAPYVGANLSSFQVVILYTNGGLSLTSTLGTNLDNFVASGGHLIMASFCWGNVSAISSFTYNSYSTYEYKGTYSSVNVSTAVYTVSHPITNGIATATGLGSQNIPNPINVTTIPGSQVIATFGDVGSTSFIAVGENGSARLVGINAYVIGSYSGLFQNTINYVCNSIYWCMSII